MEKGDLGVNIFAVKCIFTLLNFARLKSARNKIAMYLLVYL